MEWYNNGQYFKAIPVFEELMGLFKGEKSTEDIYFHYCMANYKQGSYLMSAYHFKNFVSKHPYSTRVEEALFMHAESYKQQTLEYSLDQTETVNAIEAYQSFINSYSNSKRLTEANANIDELRARLEKKALKAADLYFDTKNYRAAAVSYKNLMLDYPDIDGIIDIQYKIVKSYSKFAEQSISSKQKERYDKTIKTANAYLNRYPNSEYSELVKQIKQDAHYSTIKSTYDYAMNVGYTKRVKLLNEIVTIYNLNFPLVEDEKFILRAKNYLEKAYFQKIKTPYSQAQESDLEYKAKHYKSTIEAFNVFSTKYANSKYLNEAKRILSASEKNYKKYSNG